MAAISGIDIGKEICEALGIPIKGIKNIDIHIPADDAVTVGITKYVSPESMKKITEVIKHYQLHEVKEEGA